MASQITEELVIRLKALADEFESRLDSKLQDILHSWQNWQVRHDSEASELHELYRLVHNLAGSSATFGFHEVSRCAHELDTRLSEVMDPDIPVHADEGFSRDIDNLLDSLRSLISNCGNRQRDDVHISAVKSHHVIHGKPVVLILEDDDLYAREISSHLGHFGYHVKTCADIEQAKALIKQEMPDAIMFDIIMPDDHLGGINHYHELKAIYDDLPPTFFFSVRDDLEARLAAVRAGALGYFVKPLDYGEVIDNLEYVLTRKDHDQYRIMVIDDDVDIARHVSLVLEKAGATTRVIVDTREILHSLSDFRPELVLMDLNMPNASGVELAKVIRQYNAYIGTNIVFHSTETQVQKHMEAMRSGGDDFLIKPVPDDELVTSLFTRLKRSRSINRLMIRDSLTNLINHSNIEDILGRELTRSMRTGDVLSYAMIDIDHFKSINDNYGHLVGDNVLVSLSRFLKQKFRATDIVGRYGGEEFAVILPNTNVVSALKLFDEVRLEYSSIVHQAADEKFSVTFSVGLASCPPYSTVDGIQQAADAALYESKHNGRNQVSLAGMEDQVASDLTA